MMITVIPRFTDGVIFSAIFVIKKQMIRKDMRNVKNHYLKTIIV